MSAGRAPSPRARPPVVELAHLSGSLASCGVVASIGLTRSLRVVGRTRYRSIQALRLRGAHTSAHPDARERRKFPSQVWALLHSFTDFTPHGPGRHRDADPPMLRPRFVPLQRLAGREEPLNPSGIPTRRLRCVPRVSHPLDALLPPRPAGLVSSRFRSWGFPSRLLPHAVPYALSSAGPLRFSAKSFRTTPPPQGSGHTAQILPAGLGFSQGTAALPPWVWPFRGFLPRPAVSRATSSPPLSRFAGSAAC
jgi:hypothetical protein